MARQNKKNDMVPKHLNPDNIIFSIFTEEEIKKLSVLKICNTITFDALGYPVSGGLYDKCLGPLSERGDPCGTCFQNIYQCPGHYGHIELPLPVINPIFTKIIATILKMTCYSCFRIQIPESIKQSLSIQMRLLDKGLITEAIEIQSRISGAISDDGTFENISPESLSTISEYKKLTGSLDTDYNTALNKNIEGLKNQFLSNTLKEIKTKKSCIYCKQQLNKLNAVKDKFILVTKVVKGGSKIVTSESKHLNPEEIKTHLRSLWGNDRDVLVQLVPVLSMVESQYPTDVFFFKVIPVPPPNVRPANFVAGRVTENNQSQIYKAILHDVFLLNVIIKVIQNDGRVNILDEAATGAYTVARGSSSLEKLHLAWDSLQYNVNNILDKQGRDTGGEQGLKQIIEKKAGIIRMHMMGKRVNYAARSVITPDPNLNVDEIGIPEEFAKKLTYPVPVTSWNVEQLRKIIMNGPNVHPGAVMVEFEDGSITRINPKNQTQQESLLKRLLTPDDGGDGYKGVKMVHRHLCNGDILLLNRQPTLHRPSIMAHTARILKGEKTLRLHYANCKAYNADFDGDEMNAHFPQNELARSEGYILANVCNQYLVPKDGTPLSGLIQDHMISGVGLTVRGKFFNKYDYQQLVFQALSYKTSDIKLLPPAIIKPCMLWSGKQILSTVFLNIIPEGSVPINLTSTSKISAKSWQTRPAGKWIYGGTKLEGDDMSEAQVIIRHGELLVGVLDKTHYGATPYGLIHCMYELYGGTYATRLLSSLAKLFTCFLQWEGFTLGVHDILVTEEANIKRKKIIEESRQVGKSTMMAALGLTEDVSLNEIVNKIEEVAAIDPKLRSVIDRQYKTNLDSFTNDINKVCLPAGLLCKFPENNLQLMVQSGAKGSTVNTMQISCLLGQIELEGKRPPIMISGKSLPSFPVFEFAPRAGGYIDGRFMTGIQPQEFFFHCMAGREGLIDTAVKTSRSGYLQRCLIKHLEGITIGYDLTVRDSDKSVIQFYYGEDGMDISKSQFLNSKQLKFLFENAKAILDKDMIKQLKCVDDYDAMNEYDAKINSWKSKYGQPLAKERRTAFTVFSAVAGPKLNMNNGDKISEKTGRSRKTKTILKLWNKAGDDIKDRYKEQCLRCPDPVNSIYQPDCYFGSLNERLTELMRQNSINLTKKKDKRRFEDMLKLKSMHGICAPGEPVGLLAAQSIGEPSTQMTLNTFHFAGRGEMNVTLGIPRLREILMMASKSIKTPSMEIPFLDVPNLERKAERLRKTLTKVVVANVLEKIDVTSVLDTSPVRQQRYTLRFHFLPHHLYKDDYAVKPKYILKHMTKKYFSQMFYAIKRLAKANSSLVTIEEEKKSSRFRSNNDEDDDEAGETNVSKAGLEMDSSDEEVDDPEDAKTTRKYQQVHEGQEAQDEEDKDLERDMSDEEDVNQEGEKTKVQGQTKDDNIEATQNAVVDSYEYVKNYNYDTKDHQWCELTFALPPLFKKIDITAVLKETAAKSVMWETPNIKRAITYMKDDVLTLRTDGINIVEMFKYNELLDLNRLYSNDIHKVAENYGIEAAAKVIVKEVQDVFKVYGITVDPRHLLLIADYMTYNGTFEPLSRKGMENSASPLQQMSFESSLTFLKNATLKGKQDQLQNPSSCLMVGKPCTTGTGSFTLLQKFPVLSA